MPKQILELEEQEYFDSLDSDQKFAHLTIYQTDDTCIVLENLYLAISLGWHISIPPERFLRNLNDALQIILCCDVEKLIERGLDDVIIDAIQNKDRE